MGAGRPGPIRAKLRKALKEARDARRMTTEDEVRALVADRYAAAADDAAKGGNEAAMLRAAERLLAVMDDLPLREAKGGGAGDGSGSGNVLGLFDRDPAALG